MAEVHIVNKFSDRYTAYQITKALRNAGLSALFEDGLTAGTGSDPYRPPECLVVLWSSTQAQETWRIAVRWAMEAWSSDRLVLVKVDDAPLPIGLRDIPAISIRGSSRPVAPGKDPAPISDTKELIERVRSVVQQKTTQQAPAAAVGGKHVFISYSRQDGGTVDSLVRQIEELGYPVWIDREATGPQRYASQIVTAIRASRLVALMCSQHAFASDHVIREIYVAGDCKKPFIAFRLDPTEFPDEVLYFVSGFPRVEIAAMDPQRLHLEIRRLLS
jgi:TIR domain